MARIELKTITRIVQKCYYKVMNTNLSQKLGKALKSTPAFAAYLHGSQVKDYALPKSDVDVAVVVEDKRKIDILDFTAKLIKAIHLKNIDIRVVDKESSPLFLFSLVRDGVLVFEKDRKKRLSFETFAMKNYYYTDRIRKIYRSYL